jgi:hypothetical protein
MLEYYKFVNMGSRLREFVQDSPTNFGITNYILVVHKLCPNCIHNMREIRREKFLFSVSDLV